MNLSNEPGRVVPLTNAQIPGLTNALHSAGAGPGHCTAPPAGQPVSGGRQEAPRLSPADVTTNAGHPTSSFMMSQLQGIVGEEPAIAADVKHIRELCRTVKQNYLGQNDEEFRKNLGQLVSVCQKLAPGLCRGMEDVTSLGEHLLTILCEGALAQDTLMLVSAAFCSVLLAVEHLCEVVQMLLTYMSITESLSRLGFKMGLHSTDLEVRHPACFKMGMCHGILQMRTCSSIFEASSSVDKSGYSLGCVIFEHLQKQCTLYSRFTFSAFRLLLLWLQKVTEVSKLENATANIVFKIVNSNWENPLNGVRAQNSRLLKALLEVCENGNYTLNGPQPTPLTAAALFERTMWDQPWHMKSKYFILEVVLPKYGTKKALGQFSCLVEGLCWSLSQVLLASAGTLVYKTCLSNMALEDWLRHFLDPVLVILTSQSCGVSVQEQNLFSYWIIPTVKKFPSLLPELMFHLTVDPHFTNRPAALFAVVSLLRVSQKECVTLNLEELGIVSAENLLDASLKHSDPAVRNEAVCLLCTSLGTTLLQDFQVIDMLSMFLVDNVNTDNTQMRQCIINSVILFLLKLRDYCAQELKKIVSVADTEITVNESINARHSMQLSLSECFPSFRGSGILMLTVYFFRWLHDFIISNLEPGSNYQRKILSLQLLKSVLLYVTRSDRMPYNSGMFHQKQCKDLKTTSVGLHILITKNKLFDSDQMRFSLLKSVLDRTDDIRETSLSILTQFFCVSTKNYLEEKNLFRTAINLCKCSKFYTTESGALLIQVVAAWLSIEHPGRTVRLVSDFLKCDYSEWCKVGSVEGQSVCDGAEGQTVRNEVPEGVKGMSNTCEVAKGCVLGDGRPQDESRMPGGQPQGASVQSGLGLDPPLSIASLLLLCAEHQGDCLRRDLASAAMCGAPLHGLLTAFTLFIPQSHGTLSPAEVQRLLCLVEMTVDYLLGILSGKSAASTGTSPSFAKMMEAIEEQISDVVGEEDSPHISAAHQTILSCIWLNLKACCKVASAVASLGGEHLVSERCARVIVRVLVLCRHKGAIEAAGKALAHLVGEATSQGAATIAECVLEQFLDHLHGRAASTTRRSAGLAIFAHRLATADNLPGKRLLQRLVSEVTEVADGLVDEHSSELVDCPQGRALHVLRLLFQDSALWPHLAQRAPALAQLCLSRLTCSRWPVRNAALLLFGALVTKIAGKNGGTVEEFMCHYPELADTLLQHLKTASSTHESPVSHIVPALSLLCKLSFAVEQFADTQTNSRVAEFQLCFGKLLSNKDHMVRKLSARAYANFVPHSKVLFAAENVSSLFRKTSSGESCKFGQNGVHGIIMLAKHLTERFKLGSIAMPQEKCITLDLNAILNFHCVASYNSVLILDFNKEIQENILVANENENSKIRILEALTSADASSVMQEKFEALSFLTCSPKELPELCSETLGVRGQVEFSRPFLTALKFRLEKDSRLTKDDKTNIVCILLLAISRTLQLKTASSTSLLLEVAFTVLKETDIDHVCLSQNKSFTSLISILHADQLDSLRKGLPVAVAFVASLVSTQLTVDTSPANAAQLLSIVLRLIEEDSMPDSKHEDYRFYAAVSMQILTPSLKCLLGSGNTELGKAFLGTALMLLQDESSSVRNEAAAFVVQFRPETFGVGPVNPYHCIRKLLSMNYFEEMLPLHKIFKYFWSMFSCSEDFKCVHRTLDTVNHSNPYDHGESNIYREECKILELIFSNVANLMQIDTHFSKGQEFTTFVMDRLSSLERHIDSISHILIRVGDDPSKLSECYVKLHLILKKLHYQLLIVKQSEMTHAHKVNGKIAVCCELLTNMWRRLEYLVMPLQMSDVCT